MNIKEMISVLEELVSDKEKASIIFKTILESNDPDIIQRALELYTLLILHHGEKIQKQIAEEHDREEEYEQIIRRLENELDQYRKDYHQKTIKKEYWDEYTKVMPPQKHWKKLMEEDFPDKFLRDIKTTDDYLTEIIKEDKDPPF